MRGWGRWIGLVEFIVIVSAEIGALVVLQRGKTSWADPTLQFVAFFACRDDWCRTVPLVVRLQPDSHAGGRGSARRTYRGPNDA